MTIGRNIRYLRKKAGMSQDDLAKKLGYKSFTTIQKWEVDDAIPTFEKLKKISDIFKVSFYDLTTLDLELEDPPKYSVFEGEKLLRYQDPELNEEFETLPNPKIIFGAEEPPENFSVEDAIYKYKRIDYESQIAIHALINIEYKNKKEREELMRKYRKCETSQNKTDSANPYNLIQLPYYNKLASAGNGDFLFEDLPINTINVPKSIYNDADFVIGVDGDSMEPSFNDGDKVLVKKMDSIKEGDIGIFINEEHCYIKQLGKDGLISLNPKYPIIKGTKDIRCIGKVVGKI